MCGREVSISVAADVVSQLITDCSTPPMPRLSLSDLGTASASASVGGSLLRHHHAICLRPAEQVSAVNMYIDGELETRRFVGPYDPVSCPNVHINWVGMVPKGHTPGKWRIITDLLFSAQ